MKALVPILLIAAVLLVAVGWDDTAKRADLTFVNRGEVFTLDPQRMSYVQDFRMAYALYEGLVRWNNLDLSIEPAAADLPTISEDGLTYTFTIRENASWSNGDPVTAHDFVYSWSRLLWPDTAADYSNLLFCIEGAESFFQWRSDQLAEFTRANASTPVEERTKASLQLFDEAQAHFNGSVGLRALDGRRFQVTLARPVHYFLDLVCFAVCSPVHRPTVEGWPDSEKAIGGGGILGWFGAKEPPWTQRRFLSINPITGRLEQKHDWARPGALVTNGPYTLTQWRYKRDMRLERNPEFHDQAIVRNDSVQMLSIEDTNTMVLAFESGKIDWVADVTAEYLPDMLEQRRRYEDRHRSTLDDLMEQGLSSDEAIARLPEPTEAERRNIASRPTFGTDFYSFNCRDKLADGRVNPFADARVRRAFARSVNKQAIVNNATRLGEPVMGALIPPGSIPNYMSPKGLGFDVAEAKRELAAAGWLDRNNDGVIENSGGEPFPVIDLLWTTNSPRYKWISLELKAQWERELGVTVELRGADTKFYKEDLKQGKFMIARGRWYGDYGDPTTFLDISRTGNGNNDRAFSNAKFDGMLDAAANERDPGKRLKMLEEAERFLMEEELPLLPICQLVQSYMFEPGELKGLTSHPRLIQYLWQMEVGRD